MSGRLQDFEGDYPLKNHLAFTSYLVILYRHSFRTKRIFYKN